MNGVNLEIQPDLEGHKACVNSVNFSPDGQYLISGSDDKTIKLWDISTGKEIQSVNTEK